MVTVAWLSFEDEIVPGLYPCRDLASINERVVRHDRDAHSVACPGLGAVRRVPVSFGLHLLGSSIRHGENADEQSDRDEHHEGFVPTTLMSKDQRLHESSLPCSCRTTPADHRICRAGTSANAGGGW